MSKDSLQQSLERLHRELAATDQLDAESKALLTHVAQDIERILEGKSAHAPSLIDQVEQTAVRFEVEHPQLAGTLRELTNALTRLGV